ncbi:MAG: TetR/AcrR family transcriptional regulator [Gemmatimonadota bacterium]|nr:MAG: TetR/AcrR family transcriptional regulator [Gemmatimonadota bacterium]
MPRLTEAHFTARRHQILEAAFRCLARKGYSRMTIRDIAAEAGISVGTIYLYFENKEAVVRALSEQGRRRTAAGIEQAIPEGSPLQVLSSIFEFLLGSYDDAERAAGFKVDVQLWAEAIHHSALREMFQSNYQHWVGKLAELIAEAQRRGELPVGVEPAGLARIFMAMLVGLELQKVMEPEYRLASLVPAFLSLLRDKPGRPV